MTEFVLSYLPHAFCFIYVIKSNNCGGIQEDRVRRHTCTAMKIDKVNRTYHFSIKLSCEFCLVLCKLRRFMILFSPSVRLPVCSLTCMFDVSLLFVFCLLVLYGNVWFCFIMAITFLDRKRRLRNTRQNLSYVTKKDEI